MARGNTAYFGTDRPRPQQQVGGMGPLGGVGEMMVDDVRAGADPNQPMPEGGVPPPTLGSGGGFDPRLGVEGEAPPYEPGGAPMMDSEEGEAHSDVSSWLQSTLGISPEEAGGMTLDQIQQLAREKAPTNQELMNALGVLNTGGGNVPVEDPSMGPGAMPRYVPGQ